MLKIPLSKFLSKLLVEEMEQTLDAFVNPLSDLLPEKRLRRVVPLAIQGILTNKTPMVAAMVQSVSRQEAEYWAAAKCIYRFLENERFNHHHLFKGSYRVAQRTVKQAAFPLPPGRLGPGQLREALHQISGRGQQCV